MSRATPSRGSLNCGIFATLNPNYAGRTELPDNLQMLFRPVAMVNPDFAAIAEIIIFSEGFADSKLLARKFVEFFKLCSEQVQKVLRMIMLYSHALRYVVPSSFPPLDVSVPFQGTWSAILANFSNRLVLYRTMPPPIFQLSPQTHYDFGLRAAKAALLRAGELRRSECLKSEEAAVAQAIRSEAVPQTLCPQT